MKKITFWMFMLCIIAQTQAQLTNGNFTTEVDERIKNLNKIYERHNSYYFTVFFFLWYFTSLKL